MGPLDLAIASFELSVLAFKTMFHFRSWRRGSTGPRSLLNGSFGCSGLARLLPIRLRLERLAALEHAPGENGDSPGQGVSRVVRRIVFLENQIVVVAAERAVASAGGRADRGEFENFLENRAVPRLLPAVASRERFRFCVTGGLVSLLTLLGDAVAEGDLELPEDLGPALLTTRAAA